MFNSIIFLFQWRRTNFSLFKMYKILTGCPDKFLSKLAWPPCTVYFIFWVVTVACRFWLTWRGILPGWFCCHRKYHRTEKYGQLALCLHFSSSGIKIRFYLTQWFSVSHATFTSASLKKYFYWCFLPLKQNIEFWRQNHFKMCFWKLEIFGAKIQIFELSK